MALSHFVQKKNASDEGRVFVNITSVDIIPE